MEEWAFYEIPRRFNLAGYFLDHNLEAGRGEKIAVHSRSQTLTYQEIHRQSCQFSRMLTALGVASEQRILMILPDIPAFVPTWFGILRSGSVVAMVNPLLPASDFEHYLDYTRTPVVVTDSSTLVKLREVLEGARYLRHIILVDGTEEEQILHVKVHPWSSLDAFSASHHMASTTRDDIAIWLFTSGSTGKPRAAVHMHHDFAWNTERYAKGVLGIQESDLTLSVPKLFFGYATGTNLMFPFAVGASTVLFPERSTADALYEHLAFFRPTILTSVPTLINSMLQHSLAETADLSCLRFILSAGEALPPELYYRWIDRFKVEILDGIGSAEMFHIYISNAPGDVKPGSLGKLVPGYDARVVDDEGNSLHDGEVGALHIKGDSAALCYWNEHERSKETFAGDWCMTRDLFCRDRDGYFWYEGRADDMLKVSGISVSPLEVENCLLKHPWVAEVCVVGYEDEAGLVKPRAWLVLKAGAMPEGANLEETLKGWVKQHLAPHKYPRDFKRVDSLPKSDRGKIDRKLVKSWNM